MQNYNKQISIELYDENESVSSFIIECPVTGRKPKIEVQGVLLPNDEISSVEVRIVNFYSTKPEPYKNIKVYAGYENTEALCFSGKITNIYDENAAPEKVTVITSQVGNIYNNVNTIINISMPANFKLYDALLETKNKAGLKRNIIFDSADLKEITSIAPWSFTGNLQTALHELSGVFKSNVFFIYTNDTIKVMAKKGVLNEGNAIIINQLKSPLLLAGDTAIIKAPWNPTIKPGDVVYVSTLAYKSQGTIAAGTKREYYRVNSVEFKFNTVTGVNDMTLQVYSEKEA